MSDATGLGMTGGNRYKRKAARLWKWDTNDYLTPKVMRTQEGSVQKCVRRILRVEERICEYPSVEQEQLTYESNSVNL